MAFSFDKYKCLRLGHKNPNLTDKVGTVDIYTTSKENDLRVTLSANLRVYEQCGTVDEKLIRFLDWLEKKHGLLIRDYYTII